MVFPGPSSLWSDRGHEANRGREHQRALDCYQYFNGGDPKMERYEDMEGTARGLLSPVGD
jgi:hypothetical protein